MSLGDITDMEDLYEAIREDEFWSDLRKGQNPLIPGEGVRGGSCAAFILGEAPGADEVMAKRPFVGRAGKVLRQLMASAGLYSDPWHNSKDGGEYANCWLTNTVKYRPPRNRTPFPTEVTAARPYIRKEWQLSGVPELVIPVGAVAYAAIMGKPLSITAAAGKPFRKAGIIVWPMLHPAYGLRNADARPQMEKDWKLLGKRLKAGLYNASY